MARAAKVQSQSSEEQITFPQAVEEPKVVPRTIMSIQSPIKRTPVNVDSIEGMTRATDKMVFGQFINIEAPDQSAMVCGKFYKGMNYFAKLFKDNEKCTIPLSIARHINERCCTDTHKFILDENGNQIKNPIPKARYKFIIERDAA